MAITESGTAPPILHPTTTTATTSSFTPPAGSWVVVLVAANGNAAATTTITVSDSLTHTWSTWQQQNASNATVGGSCAVFGAFIATSAAMTVTVQWAGGGGAASGNVVTKVLLGAAATQPGAVNGATIVAGSPVVALTPTKLGSRVYGAALDYSTNATLVANANSSVIDQFLDATHGDTWATWKAAADTAALSSTSYGFTNGAANYRLSAVEILAAALAPANGQARRRFPPARQIRPGARTVTPVRAQVNPPYPTMPASHVLRLRGLLGRHARVAQVVPPQVIVTATPPPAAPVRARVKWSVLRRRQPTSPPLSQAAPPVTRRPWPRWPRPVRPRAVTPAPPQVATPPPFVALPVRARLRGWLRLARDRVAAPVPAQVTVAPPTYPPQMARRVRPLLAGRRPRGGQPVPPQVVVTPPAYPPQGLHTRVRALRWYRGRSAVAPPPQVTVTAPPWIPNRARQATARATLAHRARIASPPVEQQPAPRFVRLARKLLRLARGKAWQPVPPQVVLVPPKYTPLPARWRHPLSLGRRRRLGSDGWLVGAAQSSCDTTRPSAGITSRPSSGITAWSRPTTARPGSGTTTRPDTGQTDPPCAN